MKNPLFYLEGVQTTINLMNLSHIFRNGETWTLVTGSGSEYSINESEYIKIREAFALQNHKDDNRSEVLEQAIEILKQAKAKQEGQQ